MDEEGTLYVAMSVLHQIWKIEVDGVSFLRIVVDGRTGRVSRLSGSGVEANRDSDNGKVAGEMFSSKSS